MKHTVTKWTIGGFVFGFASAFLAEVCLLAIPAWPGAIVASAFGNDILTDHGARLGLLVPANAMVYGIVGAVIGLTRSSRLRHRDGMPRCTECDYLLVGNTSGICSECGTPFDREAVGPLKPPKNSY